MIDTIALKTSIIDLAVSGKISSRFQASDSVSEIIAALPEVSGKRKKLLGQELEYGRRPEIPSHWQWICLGQITSYGDIPTKAYFDDVSGDTWILDLEDIKAGGKILAKTRVHGKRFAGDKTVFKAGQVLYSKLRPYLKKVLVADEDGISTPELIAFDTFGGILPQYIVYCLLSSFTDRAIDKRAYGIKMPRVDAGFMVNLPIPLPPVSEQLFIVERVQQAFSALDTIDALQAQYYGNLAVLKSKLIDAAIQGKLTEQLPEDGTAENLYHQIQKEKQTLIKAGKRKKSTSLSPITEDEIPFDIPENWKWVRLGELGQLKSGFAFKSSEYTKEGIQVVRISDLAENAIESKNAAFYPLKDELASYLVVDGSFLICMTGSIGKMAWVKDGVLRYLNQRVGMFIPSAQCVPEYLWYFLHAAYVINGWEWAKRSTNGNIRNSDITELITPLPPLAEQKRIVARLEELLSLCEQHGYNEEIL